jgi:hypothetical protein
MAYDERVANRIREALANQPLVDFMVDDKLCVCVRNDVLLCRIGPDEYEATLEMNGVEPMIMNGRVANGYVYVSPQGYASREAFDSWIAKCVAFNKVAKSSKKKK